jgi:formylglycine-generating enzyme required for sulfatase activity
MSKRAGRFAGIFIFFILPLFGSKPDFISHSFVATGQSDHLLPMDNKPTTLQTEEYIIYLPQLHLPGTNDMIFIPAGEFQMGCDPLRNDGYICSPNMLPLHTVYLGAYYIETTEVTNAEYKLCEFEGACTPPYSNSSSSRTSYYNNPIYADYPVIFVDWHQADAYCRWKGGHLPTEAQWEKAARGSSDTRAYPWGDKPPDCLLANFSPVHYDRCIGDTSQVGSYPSGASSYGVLDMAGNVQEWVYDWYQEDYYSVSPYENPSGPTNGVLKIRRGGSWLNDINYLHVAFRPLYYPWFNNFHLGFRCAAYP